MSIATLRNLLACALALSLAALSLPAEAQSYRCVGKDGKKYYGSTIPTQCIGQPIEQMSAQGVVIRRFDAPVSESERAAKEAEAAKKREEDTVAKEERRRNNALLATYASEKDIDEARSRTLADNQKATKEVEARIAAIRKRQEAFDKEMEFYSEGAARPADKGAKAKPGASAPKAGAKPPPKLMEDIKNAEIDLKAQENLLAMRKKEVDTINTKYDEDKKRYQELRGKGPATQTKR